MSLRKRKGTKSEHATAIRKQQFPVSRYSCRQGSSTRHVLPTVSLHEIAGPALGRSPTQRGVPSYFASLDRLLLFLLIWKKIVALPLTALSVCANWQLVLPPFCYLCTLPLLAPLSAYHAMHRTDTKLDRLQPNRLVQKGGLHLFGWLFAVFVKSCCVPVIST